MPTHIQLKIENRAYQIWLAEGRPDKRDFDHWLLAEREILAQKTTPQSQKKQAAPKRKTSAPKRARNTV
jgi:hypothetical protein